MILKKTNVFPTRSGPRSLSLFLLRRPTRLFLKKPINEPASAAALEEVGVLALQIPVTGNFVEKIDAFAKERNYKNRDEITISRDKLPNYEAKLKIFFEE